MLKRLLSFHQVMPSILDFIGVFGIQEKPRHIQFSSFREQDLVSRAPRELKSDRLERSAKQYQMCYNLKSVLFNDADGSWSDVQAAAYHQFDVESGKSLWMFVQGHWDMKERISLMTLDSWKPGEHGLKFDSKADCLRSTFRIHLMFCEWSMEKWNERLAWIEDRVETTVSYGPSGLSMC
jgi:hypothetical protein